MHCIFSRQAKRHPDNTHLFIGFRSMHCWLNLVCFIITGFLVISCQEKPSPYMLRDTLPPDQFIFIDTLKEMAIRNYMVDPDTAEFLLDQATHACDSIGLPKKKFQILLEKAEFYQYRKPDFLKSLKNLTEAVTIFINHPGPYAEDPYIYINIGNFFYRIHYFDKASTFYNLALTIADKIEHPHAQAIALQNIGLTFRQQNLQDSSLASFLKIRHIQDVGYLTMALNFTYIAGYYLTVKNRDAALLAVDSGFRKVDQFKRQKPGDLGTVYPKLLVYSQEIESNLHYILYQYFTGIKKRDSAAVHFEKALIYARDIRSNSMLSDLLLAKLGDPFLAGRDGSDEVLADSVIYYTKLLNDPFKFQQTADTLAKLFSRKGDKTAYEKYALLNRHMTDSLEKLRGSKELFDSEILISSAAAQQVIQKLDFEKAENQRSLKYHRMVTVFTLAFAILSIFAMVFIFRQNRRLNLAYYNLTSRIRQSVRNDQAKKIQLQTQNNESMAGIIQNLENLMVNDRVFLNADLTLHELALLLQTNKTYLSSIMNQQFGMNFNEYVNQFRVREACRLIIESSDSTFSFDHILEKSGFHTKSTFYSAFKKFTGMSPATFLKKVKKER
jgi:AraC-like DNA-binding protein